MGSRTDWLFPWAKGSNKTLFVNTSRACLSKNWAVSGRHMSPLLCTKDWTKEPTGKTKNSIFPRKTLPISCLSSDKKNHPFSPCFVQGNIVPQSNARDLWVMSKVKERMFESVKLKKGKRQKPHTSQLIIQASLKAHLCTKIKEKETVQPEE